MARKNNRRNKGGGDVVGVAKVEEVEEEEKKGGVIDAIGNFMTGKTDDSKPDKEASGAVTPGGQAKEPENPDVARVKGQHVAAAKDAEMGRQTQKTLTKTRSNKVANAEEPIRRGRGKTQKKRLQK